MMPQDASCFSEPSLVMIIEPETKTRFRYESEGGSHGGLTGKHKVNGKKTYPTVKLQNYCGQSEDIFIRVTLYTEQKTEHILTFRNKKSTGNQNYIDENLKEDFTAEFRNLTILSKKKEEVYDALMDRKVRMLGRNPSRHAKDMCVKENSEAVKKEAKNILNSVLLRFDAFERRRPVVQICPPLYSEPICNQKASCRGDLKIHRMSKVSGSWRGGEEVILLCDKVQKDNIKILFYEKDVEDGWKAYASFNPADVHYQVAIPFKVPSYKENIEIEVAVALERQDELSEPRPFTYIPDDYPSKKRKMDFSETLSTPMAIPYPGSSTTASDDSLPEAVNNFSTSQVQGNENMLFPGNTNNDNFLFNFGDEVENMLGLSPMEILESIQNTFGSPFSDSSMETTEEDPMNCWDLPISASGYIKMDIGKIEGQMAHVTIDDSESSMITSNQPDMEQSRRVMHSENQQDKWKKYLHLLSKVDECGNTLLHLAVIHNKNLRTLIQMNEKAKSDILNAQNCNGQTALHIAVEKKNPGMVRNLLISGSKPNIKNADGNNCYHIACLNDFDMGLKHLLKYSKSPHGINEFNYEGLTPLHIAIKYKSSACFDILMRNCDIDLGIRDKICDKSLLHYAVEYKPSFIFPILKEAKLDVNIQDSEGNTPLHIACALGDYDTVKQLLLAKANPFIRNFKQNYPDSEEESSSDETFCGQTPADLTEDKKILELLKQASQREISGFTDSAVNSGHETLLKKICDLLDSDGRWEKIATYILDEEYFDSLKCSPSPTRTLLDYMKKQSSEEYIENFKNVLEMVDFCDAVKMITESRQP